MPYLIEILLFLLPFAAYGLWRRMNPNAEPSSIVLILAVLGIVLMVGGAFWYGLSRSMRPDTEYVPAHMEGSHIAPGHAEPRE